MKKSVIGGLSALCLIGSSPLGFAADSKSKIEDTRTTINEWVQLRQTIAKDKNEWRVQKQLLEDRIQLFEDEKTDLLSKIEEAQKGADEAAKKRAVYQEDEEHLRASTKVVKARIGDYENQIRKLHSKLPAPLKNKVDTLISNMPAEGAKTKMGDGQRMAIVVAILNEIDKFNNTVTVEKEMRDVNGKPTEVKTMYLGLAQAFYADKSGMFAGVGKPAEGEWKWEEKNDMAQQISQAIAVADASLKPPVFSNLPLSVD